MPVVEKTITVSFRHQVHFTESLFAVGNTVLAEVFASGKVEFGAGEAKVLLILDDALAEARPSLSAEMEACFAAMQGRAHLVCSPVRLLGGESIKNSSHWITEVHALIDRHHIDRHNYVIAVGGGALLDMVGFAAATAHRGVRHIRIPTTTLAQDDSGVGVKNGINAFGKKNFIGTFAPPFAVINDFDLLSSLPDRDKRAGYVEAIKVACIRDADFFDQIERDAVALARFDQAPMKELIRRSAELHLTHIATGGDPFEMGSARPLDFGHWAAHKLEQISEYRLRHGEAVAIGLALDVIYARRRGYLSAVDAERILVLLEVLRFELFAEELLFVDSRGSLCVINGLEEFREHLGGRLTITLLSKIGQGMEVHEMDIDIVTESLNELRVRHFAG